MRSGWPPPPSPADGMPGFVGEDVPVENRDYVRVMLRSVREARRWRCQYQEAKNPRALSTRSGISAAASLSRIRRAAPSPPVHAALEADEFPVAVRRMPHAPIDEVWQVLSGQVWQVTPQVRQFRPHAFAHVARLADPRHHPRP